MTIAKEHIPLGFECNRCPATFPDFKGIVEYFEANHRQMAAQPNIRQHSKESGGAPGLQTIKVVKAIQEYREISGIK